MKIIGERRTIPGWVGGVQEDAEPASGFDRYGKPIGVLDESINLIPTEVGRLAVRGGIAIATVGALADASAHQMDRSLTIFPFSPVGAAVVGQYIGGPKHWIFLCTSDFSTMVIRADLGWNSATAAVNCHGKELWEKAYVCDANLTYGSRQQLKAVDSAGTVTACVADFGSGSEAIKPYCIEVFNGNLFIAGQDNGASDDAPAMVRHALLGTDPSTGVGGWSGTGYNIIGAKGVRVTAMKAGDNYMLIAKKNELYRLSGFGRALAGWQYVVQPLDNTTGLGVFNPRALAFSKGYWYGVGESGPWRSDGESVESMVGPRRRSWANVTSLDQCWVTTHPERQHILFGFIVNGKTHTQDIWCWDESREVWSSTWTTDEETLPVTYATPIPSSIYTGPSLPPVSLSFDHASATTTSITGTVVVGDATASTEIWVDRGPGYTLDSTLAPGVTGFSITGLLSSTSYPVKPRHIKGTVTSAYAFPISGFTRLEVPGITVRAMGSSSIQVTVSDSANALQTRVLKRGGVTIKTWSSVGAGILNYTDSGLTCNTGYTYEVYNTNVAWPALIGQSTSSFASTSTFACGGGL